MVHFHVAKDDRELVDSFRLRHSIWADSGWMEPKEGHMDVDPWDALGSTKHFIAADEYGTVIGTSRILRDSPLGYRYESFAPLPAGLERVDLGEASRLCVTPSARSVEAEVLIGLCRAMLIQGSADGMVEWCAIMVAPLMRHLKRIGMRFWHVGEPVFDHGVKLLPVVSRMDQALEVILQYESPTMLRKAA